MTRENRLLIPYSVAAGIVATAGGLAVAACVSALTFAELWGVVTFLLAVLFGVASVPLFAAYVDRFPQPSRTDKP